jgi:phage tail P2-like protein
MVKTKDLLPVNLQGDKNIEAICSAIDKVFSLENDLSKLLVYLIDQVEESVLPFLAWQFHVEGYDQAQTIQEKRNLIKHAIELHRYKGTPYAIKKAFQALGLDASLQEWFDYNGDPYKFKVLVKSVIQDEATYRRFTELINEYKNVRSWLDAIGFHREYSQTLYYAFAQKNGKHYQIGLHVDTTVEPYTLYTGSAQRIGTSYQIGIYEPQVSVEPYTLYTGSAQRIATYMAIYPAN